MLKNAIQLEDWGNIALICPCQTKYISDIENICDFKGKGMKMDSSAQHQVQFICNKCSNAFDYDVKVRLFELINEYIAENGNCEGFAKYISRKGQKIRVKFIKELNQTSTDMTHKVLVIEAANLTKCPQFKS